MKVLHVLPSLSARIGGPAISVVESALALRALGVASTIFATDMAGAVSAKRHRRVMPADLPAGADRLDVRLFATRRPYRLAFAPSMQRALHDAVRRHDVVHIHMLFMYPQFAAYRAARRHGVPYVVSPCGALDPHLRTRSRVAKALTERAWQRDMLDGAAALHFKTDEEAALVADLGLRAPAVVAPNGVRCDAFGALPSGEAFRARYLGGHGGPVVLNLGRLSHKKGLDVLARAFAIVASRHPDAMLVLAGPDDEDLTPSLRALSRQLGIDARVRFTGMLRGDDKLGALAAAGVWALPSHTENFGVAVVEAMAVGLPVVISPQVNIAREIAEAGAGIVCERTPEAFAAQIIALLDDASTRVSLGGRARAFARRYDWSEVAPQLARMYASVAGRTEVEAAKEMAHAA